MRRAPRRSSREARLSIERLEGRALLAATIAESFVPNQVLVQYAPGVDEASRAALRTNVAARLTERFQTPAMRDSGAGDLEVLTLPAGVDIKSAIARLSGKPGVVFAEPNYIWRTQDSSNDPSYVSGQLWGMYGKNTAPSNQFGTEAASAWAGGNTGSSSVVVAIVDTGIDYTHPDLAENIWTNPGEIPGDGRDNDGNGFVDDVHGYDFANKDGSVFDGTPTDSVDRHGTHVAGTIGAVGNNAVGVVGMNWKVTMISAKFLGANGGTTADAVRALDYITNLKVTKGLNIVATNNSWGGGTFSQALLNAIVRGAKQNILFFAAAGNGNAVGIGQNNDRREFYPASYSTTSGAGYEAVTSVAAITSGGALASFSNYGNYSVDIGSPGVDVLSTLPFNSYGYYSGTSMATPHVTGAAALYAAIRSNPTAAQIRQAILDAGTPTSALNRKTVTGDRLNVGTFRPATSASSANATRGLTGATAENSTYAIGVLDPAANSPTDLFPKGPALVFRARRGPSVQK